ncbi:unnamed protein product, partial [Urochloa humidicola]
VPLPRRAVSLHSSQESCSSLPCRTTPWSDSGDQRCDLLSSPDRRPWTRKRCGEASSPPPQQRKSWAPTLSASTSTTPSSSAAPASSPPSTAASSAPSSSPRATPGVTAMLADQLGSAVFYCSGLLTSGVSLEISISFVDVATVGEEIEVEGKLLRAGKSVGVISVDFRKKKTGKLMAQARHTKYLAVSSRL